MDYINTNTYNKLFSDNIQTDKYSRDNDITLSIIEFFTLDKNNRKLKQKNLSEELYDYDPYYDKKINRYIYKDIKYFKISSIIDEETIHKELESNNRYGKCHKGSLKLLYFKNSSILTGYINFKGDLFLHSVIQIGDYILDYTKNLIISKDDYFRLTDFKVVQKITREQFIEDEDIIFYFKDIDLRIYLTFRDEIVNELNNKKLILKD